jgi:acetylornithine deacetylase/succinyl-diaminopimelate desuccinylase-like protein
MKTVVATYLVWMKDRVKADRNLPNICLLLVGNEENGEAEAWGTPFVLGELGLTPSLMIAGERTGERGDELFGEICTENRGVVRFEIAAHGARGHSGIPATADLSEALIEARSALSRIFAGRLTLKSGGGWHSQVRFPFIRVGTPGVYNVTADEGILGVEIRPIPQDDIHSLKAEVEAYCMECGLEARFHVMENGVVCHGENAALKTLIKAVGEASGGQAVRLGRKLPGTSARFAPGGQAVVWGQSGIGPHSKDERHFIPSIHPYYRSLNELAKLWK